MNDVKRTPPEAIEAAMAKLKLKAGEFAEAIDVSPQLVSFLRAGKRAVPADKVPLICSLTENEVKRWELRPDDWYSIWPELIGSAGAPAVPQQPAPAPA